MWRKMASLVKRSAGAGARGGAESAPGALVSMQASHSALPWGDPGGAGACSPDPQRAACVPSGKTKAANSAVNATD